MGEEEGAGRGSYRYLLGLFLSGLAQRSLSDAALPFCPPASLGVQTHCAQQSHPGGGGSGLASGMLLDRRRLRVRGPGLGAEGFQEAWGQTEV